MTPRPARAPRRRWPTGPRLRRFGRRAQRGLSMVEMMVGVAVGLFVVAGGTTLAVSQLMANRQLLLETQLQQDLRATADVVTRELRRSGYSANAATLLFYGAGGTPVSRPEFQTVELGTYGDHSVSYEYERNGFERRFAFSLSDGVVWAHFPGAGRQALTDASSLKVTQFDVRLETVPGPTPVLPCPKLCPDGSTDCWPRLNVRDLVVSIGGELVHDASIRRSLTTQVRLRNDEVVFSVAPAVPGGWMQPCPP